MNPGNEQDRNKEQQESRSCPWVRRCGGCSTIGQAYERTLAEKEAQVRRLLRPFILPEDIVGMDDPWHYRNKVHRVCACRTKGRAVTRVSGIYAEGTHQVIPVKECLLEDLTAQRIIDSVLLLAESFRIPYYDEDLRSGLLRHVLVRTAHATGQVMVILVMASTQFPGKKNFVRELCRLHPEITTIVININSRNTSMMLGEQESTVFGKGYIEDLLCGMRFGISSRSFYQVNSLQTEKLYAEAIRLAQLTGRETVLDAYCGIGTIGLIASPHAARVFGIELNRDAVRDAAENARRNAVRNITFRAGDAGEYLDRHLRDEKIDVIFMDPPRSGATRQFLTSAARSGAGRIVYISCNPETLVRDLGVLKGLGYLPRAARCHDMFPWTRHVETVVLLGRKEVDKKHIEMAFEVHTDDLGTKPANLEVGMHKQAAYAQVKSWVLENTGLKVSSLYIAQVKAEYGLIERENYNKSKKVDQKVPLCPAEKKLAIEQALRHFGDIK